jgi:hypothetical protein
VPELRSRMRTPLASRRRGRGRTGGARQGWRRDGAGGMADSALERRKKKRRHEYI